MSTHELYRCCRCKQELPEEKFSWYFNKRRGKKLRRSACKDCRRPDIAKAVRQWRRSHHDHAGKPVYCRVVDGKKRCTSCKEWLDVAQFGTHLTRIGRFRYNSRCRPCDSKHATEWNRRNREKHRLNQEAHRLAMGIKPQKKWPWKKGTREYEQNKYYRMEYGITLADYNRMLVDQNGKCAICKRSGEKLHVDHDHATGKVRELLCNSCNTALGFLNEDVSRLSAMRKYIQKHKENRPNGVENREMPPLWQRMADEGSSSTLLEVPEPVLGQAEKLSGVPNQ